MRAPCSHARMRAGVVSLTRLVFLYIFSRCREACLQLHEDAKNLLKHQLNQEHEETVRALKYVPEESNYLAFTFEGYLTLSSSRIADTVLRSVS